MKITKNQLRRIIKEEIQNSKQEVLQEEASLLEALWLIMKGSSLGVFLLLLGISPIIIYDFFRDKRLKDESAESLAQALNKAQKKFGEQKTDKMLAKLDDDIGALDDFSDAERRITTEEDPLAAALLKYRNPLSRDSRVDDDWNE